MRHLTGSLAAVLFVSPPAAAPLPCTRVLWVTADEHVLVGRTQDWTEKADSALRVHPRGLERQGAGLSPR